MASETQKAPEAQKVDRLVFIGFRVQDEHAQQLYDAASKLGVPVSSLIRSILHDRTNGFKEFILLPDPSPTPGATWSPGRPRKKRAS